MVSIQWSAILRFVAKVVCSIPIFTFSPKLTISISSTNTRLPLSEEVLVPGGQYPQRPVLRGDGTQAVRNIAGATHLLLAFDCG